MAIDTMEGGAVPVKLWIKLSDVEESAQKQLKNVAALPWAFKHIAVMPDVHAGVGATIGTVIAMKDAVAPSAVGVDVGCFRGDTPVVLVGSASDPSCVWIEKLATNGHAVEVFAYSTVDERVYAARAIPKLTRKDSPLVAVRLASQPEPILCTPDQQFLLTNNTYKQATELRHDDALRAFSLTFGVGWEPRVREDHVLYVIPLATHEDVYCLTVPDYGNFGLGAGVFVHNCGMNAVRTNLLAKHLPDNLHDVRLQIERDVPTGFNAHAVGILDNDRVGGGIKSVAQNLMAEFDTLTPEVRGFTEKAWRQVGTLGSGNHFIDVCVDEEQHVWIVLHSGSRYIGNKIAEVHVKTAMAQPHNRELPDPNLAVLLAGTSEFESYWNDVKWAQRYASLNRDAMVALIFDGLSRRFKDLEFVEHIWCSHNYCAAEEHYGEKVIVTRKGAIRAAAGQPGIIPSAMGGKTFIVRGLGNPESFESAAHGAGRKMSRGQARRTFTVHDLEALTKGVECDKTEAVLDEIPSAYKNIDAVMDNQRDLVETMHVLQALLTVKGGDEKPHGRGDKRNKPQRGGVRE